MAIITYETLCKKLRELYDSRWILALSKYTGYSEEFLVNLFNQNNSYFLHDDYECFLEIIDDAEKIKHVNDVLLSPFHITKITDNYKNGKIKFLDCLFFKEKLRLNFEKYNTIHSNIPTLETKRLDKNWKAFLTICEREELNPLDMIQLQIDWLNDLPVYNSILREGASDLAAVSLYFDRSQKTRYIKQKDSYNHNRTFEVWQSSTYKAVQRKRHGNWF